MYGNTSHMHLCLPTVKRLPIPPLNIFWAVFCRTQDGCKPVSLAWIVNPQTIFLCIKRCWFNSQTNVRPSHKLNAIHLCFNSQLNLPLLLSQGRNSPTEPDLQTFNWTPIRDVALASACFYRLPLLLESIYKPKGR